MALPIPKSYEPMEARLIERFHGQNWQYEPKWTDFVVWLFGREKGRIAIEKGTAAREIFSRNRGGTAGDRCQTVRDRFELVVPTEHGLSFDALLQRIIQRLRESKSLPVKRPP